MGAYATAAAAAFTAFAAAFAAFEFIAPQASSDKKPVGCSPPRRLTFIEEAFSFLSVSASATHSCLSFIPRLFEGK